MDLSRSLQTTAGPRNSSAVATSVSWGASSVQSRQSHGGSGATSSASCRGTQFRYQPERTLGHQLHHSCCTPACTPEPFESRTGGERQASSPRKWAPRRARLGATPWPARCPCCASDSAASRTGPTRPLCRSQRTREGTSGRRARCGHDRTRAATLYHSRQTFCTFRLIHAAAPPVGGFARSQSRNQC